MELKDIYESLNSSIIKKTGMLEEKTKNINAVQEKKIKLEKELEIETRKKILLNKVSAKARETAYEMFSRIATRGAKFMFGDNIAIKIVQGEHDLKPTADFVVSTQYNSDSDNVYMVDVDPTDSSGGGCADIVALSSLFAMNILNENNNSAPLFLDEPTKYVSDIHHVHAAKFIKDLSESYKKQVIMVTHASETKYESDAVFEVISENGISQVNKISQIEENL